ncbi:MAG: YihY family inner membrane protein [Anaeromyxobacter sp.]|nr:YihY family inner membrane protein [Anaeromyxobacter sp.]MBL0275813.1 YihY family inner membrane protein [Anaeromyxobacter sp.]
MALTYLSLFALVPALLVAFSVVQAFTGMARMADQVHEFLLDNLAVGARATLEPYLEKFVGNAHAASAGLVGGALLVWSMVSLFSSVDEAINDVWGVRKLRRLRDQAVIYWVGLTVGPLLLAGSIWLGHSVRTWLGGTGLGFLAVASGVLLTCAFFSTLYLLVPNTKVNLWAALGGGLLAGLAWELAKWGYALAVTRFFRYHVIYGSVAAVPTFLLWLYVSWTIVLFGARVAFVVQNAPVLWHGGPLVDHPTTREVLAGRVVLEVALAFDEGGGGAAPAGTRGGRGSPDVGALVRRLGVRGEDIAEVVESLRAARLLEDLSGGGLVPGRPAERITLLDVRLAVRGQIPRHPAGGEAAVDRVLAEVDAEAEARLAATTLRALCDEEHARRAAAPGAAPVGGALVEASGAAPGGRASA